MQKATNYTAYNKPTHLRIGCTGRAARREPVQTFGGQV